MTTDNSLGTGGAMATPAGASTPEASSARGKKARRRKNADGTMSLVEHIYELRRRLFFSLIGLFIGTIAGFVWYGHGFLGIPSLGDILRGPYCKLPADIRADFSSDGSCKLLATGPFEMFMLRLKVGALAGAVASSPVWLGQIWMFITPGLHKNEKRWTRIFVSIGVVLFVFGATIAYFVVSYGLEFLLTVGSETSITALDGARYFGFLLALLLIFGVSFEVPLVLIMLNIVGILSYENLAGKRRLIVVLLFIFAAFITPGQDPFSMVVLACSLTLLVEFAIQFARINDKRRSRERPDWMDLDDDAASSIESSGPLSAGAADIKAEPIAPAAPINRGGVPRATNQLPNMIGAEERGTLTQRSTSDFDDVL